MSICKICLKDKQLIKSHIYPEWIYRAIYPNGKVEGRSLLVISSNNPRAKKSRIGIYDDQILCFDCDNRIGFFDSIGKEALMDNHLNLLEDLENIGKLYTINNINPVQLKNFFLSMLLRACLSEREEYKDINLPSKFIDALKNIVMDNLETQSDEFSIIITKFRAHNLKNASEKYTQVPYRNRLKGVNFFTLNVSNGYKVFIKVDQRPIDSSLLPLVIKPNYPIYVMAYEYFEESIELDWLKKYLP